MNVAIGNLVNTRPHPGPLPRGEREVFAASLGNSQLDSRAAITNYWERLQAVSSSGVKVRADTIQSEPPYVGCYDQNE